MNNDSQAKTLAGVQSALRAGDIPLALELVTSWLAADRENPEARYFDAVIQRRIGNIELALEKLDALLGEHPLHSRALQERAHCHRTRGDLDRALLDYQRATRLNPALLASWQYLSRLLRGRGELALSKQCDVQVDYLCSLPQALLVVLDLISRGKLGSAETLCKRFMQKNPRHIEGMRILAEIAVKMGSLDDAALLLDTAAEMAPENHKVLVDHVHLARKQQHFEESYQRAQALLNKQPDNPQFLSIAGVEAMQIGKYDEAIARFDEVLRAIPGDPITLTSKGHALKTCGDADGAVALYRHAIASNRAYGEAWHALSNLKTYRFSEDEIATMEALLLDEQLDHASSIFIEFALGKAYEDGADYEKSMQHYERGNRLKRSQSIYDANRMQADMAEQKRICTRDLFARHEGRGLTARDPIFVVGLPRAGSTLIEQILSSHSQVDGTLELPNILALAQRLRRESEHGGYPRVMELLNSDTYRGFGEQYLEDTQIHRQGAPYFIDKMPNNFRHIGLIKLILPNAKIIDARRHPLACCFSGYKQLFAEGQEFSYSLTDMGRYYRDYVDLMDHWHSVLPGQILQVDNEAVIEDLDGQVRRLLDFCGLEFEEQCLRYWETDRAVKTPSSEQVRRPVSSKGQHQWRNFEPWLDELKTALGDDLVNLSLNE